MSTRRRKSEIIRDLAVLVDHEGFGRGNAPYVLVRLAVAVSCRYVYNTPLQAAREALEAASILRRLDDGTLDVATLLDEPCTNLDAAREAYVAQYEDQLTAACRALAGVE